MERVFLIVMCASVVLLATAIGLASPPAKQDLTKAGASLLQRVVPR
jgi:hypothetical protein